MFVMVTSRNVSSPLTYRLITAIKGALKHLKDCIGLRWGSLSSRE